MERSCCAVMCYDVNAQLFVQWFWRAATQGHWWELQTLSNDNINWIYIGRIWWKLQSHNSILKMYFLACAYWVVLITDQFWIKWFFGKKVIFWPKKAFFGKKWLFDPLHSTAQQSCFRTFCLGANFLPFYEKKNSGTFRQNISDQFFHFYPHIFGHISWILVNK